MRQAPSCSGFLRAAGSFVQLVPSCRCRLDVRCCIHVPKQFYVMTIGLRYHVAVLVRDEKDVKELRTKDEHILAQHHPIGGANPSFFDPVQLKGAGHLWWDAPILCGAEMKSWHLSLSQSSLPILFLGPVDIVKHRAIWSRCFGFCCKMNQLIEMCSAYCSTRRVLQQFTTSQRRRRRKSSGQTGEKST